MKIAWITTFYRTEELSHVRRLKKEINKIGFSNSSIFVSDCRNNNKGYAAGINIGLKNALYKGFDIFIICNPDISFNKITSDNLLTGKKYFDIWGCAMKQNNKIYYGGKIDKWRMSGGLIEQKPDKRFVKRDFISGAFMIVKKKVLVKLGLLDEKYFIYYEEVDYCYKAKQKGFKIGIDSHIAYSHLEISNKANPKKNYLLAKNRLKFFWKYSTYKQKIREVIRLPKTILEEIRNTKLFAKKSFLFNFFSLNVSSVIIKVLNFILFLFLIKYLNAEEYGIYTLIWAQVTILSPLLDFGTTSYGVVHITKNKEKEFNILFTFRMALALLIFIATIVMTIFMFKNNPKLNVYSIITATVIFTNMFSGSYFIWSAIQRKLYLSSRNTIIFTAILSILCIVSLIITHRLLYVFLVMFVLYNIYSLVNFMIIKYEIKSLSFKISFKDWKKVLKQSYVYVLISFFGGLYFKADVFILQILKGIGAVGVYSAGYKFFEALMFIAASYSISSTPVLVRISNNETYLFSKLVKDMLFLLCIGFGIAFGVLFISPIIVPLLFNLKYIESIKVLQIVIFALPFILFNSIWMNVLYVFKKAHFVIFTLLFQTILNIALNYIFIPKFSFIASSYITVFSEMINTIILLLICRMVWLKVYKKQYENIN
ncbi:MAG: oligosaccharide flippase family protein [bacterium]|nr:oligosaccharide flippase family protein [bacterium]